MAFDGITLNSLVCELKRKTLNGRIIKIQQPEKDGILLIIKAQKETSRIYISADASLPLMYITDEIRKSPSVAPNFCMLLRKYIGNGRIIDIKQPEFERIADIEIEHFSEMGDLIHEHLIFEIMGRRSNIILVGENGVILDAIKRVPGDLSTVRIILPGQKYEMPPSQNKKNPFYYKEREQFNELLKMTGAVGKMFPSCITGFAKQTGEEICLRANVDPRVNVSELSNNDIEHLFDAYIKLINDIESENYNPIIFFEHGIPHDYAAFDSECMMEKKKYSSMSELLQNYYHDKERAVRIHQKAQDLKRVIDHAVERASKKLDIQNAQLDGTKNRDMLRIYGELLNTYGYSLSGGEKNFVCQNYYDEGREINIPLDPLLTASENSKKYFAKYNKEKRTYAALTEWTEKTKEELDYLISARHALQIADSEGDIAELRMELRKSGILQSEKKTKKEERRDKSNGQSKSRPMHFVTSDGYDIYVGRNNLQNDYLTFHVAGSSDMWFHAKKIPGSHVILRRHGNEEFPDHAYIDAARLAAHFSSTGDASKVEIDYTERKNLKKPPAAHPGFVIYHTNYSMVSGTDISELREIVENES